MSRIIICAECGKAFYGERSRGTCCSVKCSQRYIERGREERLELLHLAETKEKREPRVDCRMYNPNTHSCNALTATWCEWEDCVFYKRKED